MSKLLAIAKRENKRDSMRLLDSAEITTDGVEGIYVEKPESRKVTILSKESWEATCKDLGSDISWTTRRANLLVEGIDLMESKGMRILIGEVILEVSGETTPCGLMDQLRPGLLNALRSDWRGGVVCRVINPGYIQVGDMVSRTNIM